MATGDAPRTDPPPPAESPKSDDFGCSALIVMGAVLLGMIVLFDRAGPGGSLGAGIASFGLAVVGFGVVWVTGRRR